MSLLIATYATTNTRQPRVPIFQARETHTRVIHTKRSSELALRRLIRHSGANGDSAGTRRGGSAPTHYIQVGSSITTKTQLRNLAPSGKTQKVAGGLRGRSEAHSGRDADDGATAYRQRTSSVSRRSRASHTDVVSRTPGIKGTSKADAVTRQRSGNEGGGGNRAGGRRETRRAGERALWRLWRLERPENVLPGGRGKTSDETKWRTSTRRRTRHASTVVAWRRAVSRGAGRIAARSKRRECDALIKWHLTLSPSPSLARWLNRSLRPEGYIRLPRFSRMDHARTLSRSDTVTRIMACTCSADAAERPVRAERKIERRR